MKLRHMVGERFRNRPSEASLQSHSILLRGGYIKNVANGIFSLYTPMRRITQKIEAIIRGEMEALSGQEVLLPVVMPAALWQQSGRYDAIGGELTRFCDRGGSPLVLGMTHEEAAVQLVREYAVSYSMYPFMIYQIQTKFRDEARPRGGLLRVREFTMKDAYSFHTSQADLEDYYTRVLDAYTRIFRRVGLPEVIAVASDSGMMGGKLSHEFMLLSSAGEDSIAVCPHCGYRANLEAAQCVSSEASERIPQELSRVCTPNCCSISQVCGLLNCDSQSCCKAVVYQDKNGAYIVVFIRGDYEINEAKLKGFLGYEVFEASISEDSGLCEGFIGPYKLAFTGTVLYDRSLQGALNLVCGANEPGFHYTGLNLARDLEGLEYHDFAKIRQGDRCPECARPSITVSKGIEVGNIFQLGTKYTEAMGMTYLDQNGKVQYPVMGCYGIGIGRLAASVCEVRHDEYGPIWPMSIAPWQVQLCALRSDEASVRLMADGIYEALEKAGIEVLYDDRPVSAGVMFADADLLGVPLRLIISPRTMKKDVCEVVSRDKTMREEIPIPELIGRVKELIAQEISALS